MKTTNKIIKNHPIISVNGSNVIDNNSEIEVFYIKDLSSGKYLTENEDLVEDICSAAHFETMEEAVLFINPAENHWAYIDCEKIKREYANI